jgi:hypothetical protein
MSAQQINGLALLLVSVAVVILSVGVAWGRARSRATCRKRLVYHLVGLPLVVGAALCNGVSNIIEGGA